METLPPPDPTIDLPVALYDQLVQTFMALLPRRPGETPEALRARTLVAVAKVAALLPADANEADLAAHWILARAQADQMLLLLRQHAGDTGLAKRLKVEYQSTVKMALSVHTHLIQVQADRRKRASIPTAANEDAWARHTAEQYMLAALAEIEAGTASSKTASVTAQTAAAEGNISKNKANSHIETIETPMSANSSNPDLAGLGEAALRRIRLNAIRPSPPKSQMIH